MSDVWRTPGPMVATPLTDEQRCRAVQAVAQHATDATELTELLDMLGLTAAQGRPSAAAEGVVAEIPEPLRRIREFAGELAEMRRNQATKPARRRGHRAATHR